MHPWIEFDSTALTVFGHTHPMNQVRDVKSMQSYGSLVMSAIPDIVHVELDAGGISCEQMVAVDMDLRSLGNR